MAKMFGPDGWSDHNITTRFLIAAPRSFNAETRSVNAVISAGAPVARTYGTEILKISSGAIIVDRVKSAMCPVLDSHRADHIAFALGRVVNTWIERGALMGTLTFNQTSEGDAALGMISRCEISGVSAGYKVHQWQVADEDGRVIDPETTQWDESLVFTALKWELLEVSIVSVPADSLAGVRSFDDLVYRGDDLVNVRARMRARQSISDRNSLLL